MSLAQYTDLSGQAPLPVLGSAQTVRPAVRIVPVPPRTNYRGQIRPVKLLLDEVMFTGRVPVSTWTFAFSLHHKLWVSGLTTLYFGKRMAMNKTLYQGKLYVPDRRLDLQMGITAYNSYGDVLRADTSLRGYAQGAGNDHAQLITIEEDWMQLMFRIRVQVS